MLPLVMCITNYYYITYHIRDMNIYITIIIYTKLQNTPQIYMQ